MFILLGLGNPGEKYRYTRHNAGWILLDEIFGENDWYKEGYAQALCKEVIVQGVSLRICKPLTFMNKSGITAHYFKEKHDVSPENVIVLYDDIDLPVGSARISFDRGTGGHNGIASVESHLETKAFPRIRIGIGREGARGRDFVLSRFDPEEKEELLNLVPLIEGMIASIITDGHEVAMNKFNKKNERQTEGEEAS